MTPEPSTVTVADLGEQLLLQRLQAFCPSDLVGDDAAVLSTPPSEDLVVTTDLLVDGVHFSLGLATPEVNTTPPWDAGWRAAAANLSDLAAMGATPLGMTVGLGLPGHLPVTWLEQLYQGLTACLQPYHTPIVGGDICRSSVTTLAITAFGTVAPTQVIRRSQAQIGDAIVVTGVHGAARAGLELLLHPDVAATLPASRRSQLITAHQRPIPRLDVLPLLWRSLAAAAPERQAMVAGMDSSDGLADAVLQICRASGVGACLDRLAIPIPPDLCPWVTPEQAMEWALYGGEDFELVLCLPASVAHHFVTQLGAGAAVIGEILAGTGVSLIDPTGHLPVQCLSLGRGYQHFPH
ncbi:thiamine monophosphate kinase [Neosynechococcus sphagnicola sy1]|uniref:Thiamine-monophosphate kinase n=1 Tax=Neosynechococcus sphagnicola sy1 TaxID=1497020 RepID=A0A098TJ14_9CYAN|nr:thiamine-phosphate kinase [Neosynechococcus sphagnicola]KGF72041.1 thiamine monophosphate kinase [Neosynechococcus sphagnicola sy1]